MKERTKVRAEAERRSASKRSPAVLEYQLRELGVPLDETLDDLVKTL
jgi:hypothetical protein